MMSSEEDTDCFGLYDDKLQLLKTQQNSVVTNNFSNSNVNFNGNSSNNNNTVSYDSKQQRSNRQRVDAGEPRNSYSSIPNFTSRPSFMSSAGAAGGLYGALLSQTQSAHFVGGLFGPNGFGSAKMLNELFGRQMKQAQDAATGGTGLPALDTTMLAAAMESATNGGGVSPTTTPSKMALNNNNSNNNNNNGGFESSESNGGGVGSPLIRRASCSDRSDGAGSTSPIAAVDQQQLQPNDLAHHMLRNILQGKKELMALDHELRSAMNGGVGGLSANSNASPSDNNNCLKSNNNNNNNNSSANNNNISNKSICEIQIKSEPNSANTTNCSSSSGGSSAGVGGSGKSKLDDDDKDDQEEEEDEEEEEEDKSNGGEEAALPQPKKEVTDADEMLMDEELLRGGGAGSDMESLGSPSGNSVDNDLILCNNSNNSKDAAELEAELDKDAAASVTSSTAKSADKPADMKRARVENIVSSMQSAQHAVNGCKKRKLYQPQQHDNTAIERYAAVAAGLNFGFNIQSLMLDASEEDEEMETSQIHEKRVEKNALKSQLRSMQEQLAEMQQKYVQLCSRMEQESDCQEIDDTASDSIDGAVEEVASPSPSPPSRTPSVNCEKTSGSGGARLAKENKERLESHMLSQMMSKMMSSKMHAQPPPPPPQQQQHHLPPHATFNGAAAHPLLQHMPHVPPGAEHHLPHHPHPHPAISNAAAMYLGQKFFLEQEARLAKEAADHHERQQLAQQRQQEQRHRQEQQEQQQQQQRQREEREREREAAAAAAAAVAAAKMPSPIKSDISEKFQMLRSPTSALGGAAMSGSDLEGLADVLKSEITSSLSALVDTIVTRFVHQRRMYSKQSDAVAAAAEQLNKDLLMASQILDRKSPRTKSSQQETGKSGGNKEASGGKADMTLGAGNQSAAMFQAPKPPPQGMNPVAAAALYNSMSGVLNGPGHAVNPFCMPEPRDQPHQEQNEALSLVVAPKKKRHKVTDTRITPRTVSRILAQDGIDPSQQQSSQNGVVSDAQALSNHVQSKYHHVVGGVPVSLSNGHHHQQPSSLTNTTPSQSPSPRSSVNAYHPQQQQPPMPVSLPTSVAIPNPSLHESQVFSPYSPFFNPHHGPHGGPHHGGLHAPPTSAQLHHMKMSSSPPGLGGMMDTRDSPPLPHPPTMLHPALLAAAHHGSSPDYSAHLRAAMDAQDRNSDCNSADMQFDGIQPTSSTLSSMHLRKAKLMFFWVRYPSSAVLKMYFPDIKFNKNNTAQLVKWFSNFREFYYIQMEKYARQAITEGVKSADDLHVGGDSELYRVLNLHYNRNNNIEVPQNFRFVVEQTLREFFRAIQGGKDIEQSWKKSIYKIISRMDDPVPEYFKSPEFLEQLA